jgi:hypothetical protein
LVSLLTLNTVENHTVYSGGLVKEITIHKG